MTNNWACLILLHSHMVILCLREVVPIRHEQFFGCCFLRASLLELNPNHTSINFMPLFHTHGIRVNVLPFLMTGGGVLCTQVHYTMHYTMFLNLTFHLFCWQSFGIAETPESILDKLANFTPAITAYSAVPTMHELILEVLS